MTNPASSSSGSMMQKLRSSMFTPKSSVPQASSQTTSIPLASPVPQVVADSVPQQPPVQQSPILQSPILQPPAQQASIQQPPAELSNSQKLVIWEESISQAMSQRSASQPATASVSPTPTPTNPSQVAPQAVPLAIQQATDTLNPPQARPTSTAKEAVQATSTLDQAQVDGGSLVQYVEHEKLPEIPVEVENFIQRVENMQDMAPREVVIADGTQESAAPSYPSRPVVVLPITPELEKKGAWKSPVWSIRWLVEWSRKIIKIFAGKVVYRESQSTEENHSA
jgi:hypothetical protein